MIRIKSMLAPCLVAGFLLGCGGASPAGPAIPPPPEMPPVQEGAPQPEPESKEDAARSFLAQIDRDLHDLYLRRDRASWVNMTYITDDTEAMAASGEEAAMEYLTRKVNDARAFDGANLRADTARQLWLLKLQNAAPAPSDAKERAELAGILTSMSSDYGKGRFCPARLAKSKQPCLSLTDLSTTLAESRKADELKEAWTGWRTISPPLRTRYARFVELANKGAREMGFADLGARWRSGYDMPPAQFEAEVERLWQQVKPLYDQLHCYVRGQLQKKYGKETVPELAPIPAHLLGNMWAQEWGNIAELATPYPDQRGVDVTKALKAKKVDATAMVKMGESFFTSLGFEPLPGTFWERSMFTKPSDRAVMCHASAWDIGYRRDLRIKMCIKPNYEDLVTIHHELGHVFYYQEYYKTPILFQDGANDGFHEGIGDTIALSVTPTYLKQTGLIGAVPGGEKARVNEQMKMALDKVAFLPFGLLIDKWRWDVFAGKIGRERYNTAWWELVRAYQGVAPPTARDETFFDPGAKYHIPANTPYMRYFLARILQFQFHRALCKEAGFAGALDQCSIFGNRAAGDKLRAMMQLGASKPWPAALKVLGEERMDAAALVEYFAPLQKYLEEQNRGKTCGW